MNRVKLPPRPEDVAANDAAIERAYQAAAAEAEHRDELERRLGIRIPRNGDYMPVPPVWVGPLIGGKSASKTP